MNIGVRVSFRIMVFSSSPCGASLFHFTDGETEEAGQATFPGPQGQGVTKTVASRHGPYLASPQDHTARGEGTHGACFMRPPWHGTGGFKTTDIHSPRVLARNGKIKVTAPSLRRL